jgi:imidazolonepropionase-like amidohydrolase
MSPAQAIGAATKNGAIAARSAAESGTIEAGKRADLLLLDADPLADIHNIRKISAIYVQGHAVDRRGLPERRVLSRATAGSSH